MRISTVVMAIIVLLMVAALLVKMDEPRREHAQRWMEECSKYEPRYQCEHKWRMAR